MTSELSLKKALLTTVLLLLVSGQFTASLTGEALTQGISAVPAVYASGEYGTNFKGEPLAQFEYHDNNLEAIEGRMENIHLNKGHIRKIEAELSSRGAPFSS